ncbi:protein SENSITIVE TO UV 2 [Impatiens glandulifera]|uniref:protein SENSITIVE TO UV 2 n=1 Tax=Impatiens glandulifera TaxID=253017 RepID=UPI001FB174E7|nr:protein SENSITIVE TO UV 2 [Impatiens glandulifera]
MNNDLLDDLDDDFLEALEQFEERHALTCSTNPNYHPPPPPPPPSTSSHSPPLPLHILVPQADGLCFSPPHELSQRTVDYDTNTLNSCIPGLPRLPPPQLLRSPKAGEKEIDRLKRELNRAHKQVSDLELELKKERTKKEEQLQSIVLHTRENDAEVHLRKRKNLEHEFHTKDYPSSSHQRFPNGNSLSDQIPVPSTFKAIGIQTEEAAERSPLTSDNVKPKVDSSSLQQCSSRLLSLWNPTKKRGLQKDILSKLFLACESDFHILFGCLSTNSSLEKATLSAPHESSLQVHFQAHVHIADTTKISHLYSLLTKIGSGLVELDTLIDALVDLCRTENAIIVYRALHILHIVLNHLSSLGEEPDKRDNIVVDEEPSSGSKTEDPYGRLSKETRTIFDVDTNATFSGNKASSSRIQRNNRLLGNEFLISKCSLDWVFVFKSMHEIIMRHTQECVKLEAVSITNLIVLRTNAYLGRVKYGSKPVFQSISLLLQKDAGSSVQKQAVHLLYLLINCPELLAMFIAFYKEEESAGVVNDDSKIESSSGGCRVILDGLADCLTCVGSGIKELKLRRITITLLAYLASSGKSSCEIVLSHKIFRRSNFLQLILQMLTSEMDAEVVDSAQPQELFRERTLLIREALIFLNRLVSNLQYSTPVLRLLTSTRDMTSLTVDIANRLSRKTKWSWQSDGLTKQIRESEVVDLARVFKKRVFAFLGDNYY